jgi:hypothetical protein
MGIRQLLGLKSSIEDVSFFPTYISMISYVLASHTSKGGNENQAAILGMVQLNMPQIQCYNHLGKTIKDEIYDFNYWREDFYMPTCAIPFFHIPPSSKFIWVATTHVDWLIIDSYSCLITKFILDTWKTIAITFKTNFPISMAQQMHLWV